MKGYFLILCMVVSCSACVTTQPSYLADAENTRLKTAAGENWDIEYHQNEIILISKKECWFYYGVSLPPMTEEQFVRYVKENGRKDFYRIHFKFVPKWTEKEKNHAERHNAEIVGLQSELPEKYGIEDLSPTRDGSFFPETNDDEVKIDAFQKEYQELETRLIDIPDFHSEKYSIFITDNQLEFELVWSENHEVYLDLGEIFTD